MISMHFQVSAGDVYSFRVYLNDKGVSEEQLENPERFLSSYAIERRIRQGREIDLTDIPIASHLIDSLTAAGGEVVTQSKWLSTVVLSGKDSLITEQFLRYEFVDSVKWVWKGEANTPEKSDREKRYYTSEDSLLPSYYGYAAPQIEMLRGNKLHQDGFTGKGMRIAVIDAGFLYADRINAFDSLQLGGTYNFVSPGESVFEEDEHGTRVLSCLAANLPGIMVGTAPHATYWLLKSEDNRSEYPIEEDFWAAAVEYADSAGVDIITSSLGYFTFDAEEMNYIHDALDGRTAFISQAASMVAEKGILLFSSAGNEGNGHWQKITFPSDANRIVTVGSVTGEKVKSNFSSTGFTSDFRVKPDVMALGSSACVIDSGGSIRYVNGTSFSTPILAGLGACLWQALPSLTNEQIIDLIQKASSQYKQPDAEFGYGIPNMHKAYKMGESYATK